MARSYFVTASGTDIGKTYVTCAMIRGLNERSVSADALKPVLSGFDPAHPKDSDTGRLADALGAPLTPERLGRMTPWRYRAALSPDMAAAREGQSIPVDEVAHYVRDTCDASSVEVMFVEGAGGVMAPLDAHRTIRDLMRAAGFPALVVGGTYLGAISHLLTALEALRGYADVSAVVLSESPENPVPPSETRAAIMRFAPATPVFIVARDGRAPPDLLAHLIGG